MGIFDKIFGSNKLKNYLDMEKEYQDLMIQKKRWLTICIKQRGYSDAQQIEYNQMKKRYEELVINLKELKPDKLFIDWSDI